MCIPKVSKEQGFTSSSAPHWVGKELQEPTGSDKTNDGANRRSSDDNDEWLPEEEVWNQANDEAEGNRRAKQKGSGKSKTAKHVQKERRRRQKMHDLVNDLKSMVSTYRQANGICDENNSTTIEVLTCSRDLLSDLLNKLGYGSNLCHSDSSSLNPTTLEQHHGSSKRGASEVAPDAPPTKKQEVTDAFTSEGQWSEAIQPVSTQPQHSAPMMFNAALPPMSLPISTSQAPTPQQCQPLLGSLGGSFLPSMSQAPGWTDMDNFSSDDLFGEQVPTAGPPVNCCSMPSPFGQQCLGF